MQNIYNKKYKKLRRFIFVTFEWYTFQPWRESQEPDVENMQVIGFSKWFSREEAFDNLIKENEYLLDMTFDEIWCFGLLSSEYNCMFSISEKSSKKKKTK